MKTTAGTGAHILHRKFDGFFELSVACAKWKRAVEVSYGLFGDGQNAVKIRIDDVMFRGHTITDEVRHMPDVIKYIEAKAWEDARHRSELILMQRWNEKKGDGSRAGNIIKRVLNKHTGGYKNRFSSI
jgi:hypothetical protein